MPVVAGLVAVWLALVVVLLVTGRRDEKTGQLKEAVRLVPDIIRLLGRLAADLIPPRGVCIRLVLLLAYLAMPLGLVPDFISIAGYADDAIIVALAFRSVTRRAGPEALGRALASRTASAPHDASRACGPGLRVITM
jgi:uncharacterized membrane protein YkvA (DUF1232 family)